MLRWKGKREGVFGMGELAAGKIKPPPPLFHDLLLDGSLTMISAAPYTGKSLLLASMAISLDTGLPLFGKFAPAQGKKVLMVAQDAPTWDYAGQATKIARGYGLSNEQLELLDTQLIVNRAVQVTDPKFLDDIRVLREEFEFDVLMLDAFWTIHNMNENDNTQMAFVMETLKAVREEFSCAVIYAHHVRKPSGSPDSVDVGANNRARGSSVIAAAVDANLELQRRGDLVRIATGKNRGMGHSDPPAYKIIEVPDERGEALALVSATEDNSRQMFLLDLVAEETKRADIVAAYVEKYPAMTPGQRTKAIDNDLQYLRSLNKITNVRFGYWKAK